MEVLIIHDNGQWSLTKAEPNAVGGDDYKSFRGFSRHGSLPEDRGTKGSVHNSGNKRAPKQMSDERMRGEVPTPVRSFDDDRDPGSPGPLGDRK